MSSLAVASQNGSTPGDSNGGAQSERTKQPRIDMTYLVRALLKFSASDLHLKAGRPPLFRINGKIVPAKMPDMTAELIKSAVYEILTSKQMHDLETKLQIDFSFSLERLGRFRCNVYFQKGTLSVAVRTIPLEVPSLDSIGAPSVIKELCQRHRGLILITGPTGSGKSTTLAATIQEINQSRYVHVLTLEDPIEFIYRDDRAAISQREVGVDTLSLREGLVAGLRQDPDVIVIGEMRDYETMRVALTAAETGHLVLSTMHTQDAKGTIERILDAFPTGEKNQIRIQLASTLGAVISQQLIPRADGSGRVLAAEVMVKSPTIENQILKNELDQIQGAIANSNTYYHMQTLNQALYRLAKQGAISTNDALAASPQPDELSQQLSGIVRE